MSNHFKPKKDSTLCIILFSIVFLTACDKAIIDNTQKNHTQVKPLSYVTSVNLLALATTDTSSLQEPWNARDTDLLSMARAIPAKSEVQPELLLPITDTINNNTGNTNNSSTNNATANTTVVSANAITETITPCADSGTRTSTVDNQSPPWFSQGDVNTVIYDNCSSGGTTINGQRVSSVDVMTGQQFIDPDWSLKTTLSRDITRTENVSGNTSSVVGLSSVSMAVTNTVNFVQETSGSWVNVRPNNGVNTEDVFTYNITYAWEDTLTGGYQWDFNVQTESTNAMLGSTLTRSLETLIGVNYMPPEAGKLEITKTMFDTVRVTTVTATGAGAVLVEVDSDNDGVIDSSVESTWWQVMLDPILYQYF